MTTPRVCFLVLAHHQPRHVARLLEALVEDGDAAVVHVDADVDQDGFRDRAPSNVSFVDQRAKVRWGGWSVVDATLRLMARARSEVPDADLYWLTSGDSYPLRPLEVVKQWLGTRPGTEFLNLLPMPAPSVDKPISRLSHHWIEHDPRRHPALHQGLAVAHRLARRPYRAALEGWQPWCGSQWFTLTADAVDLVLATAASRTRLVRLCRTSFVPDEHFVHTILGNSSLRPRISPALHYAPFGAGGASPPVLTGEVVERLAAQPTSLVTDAYGARTVLMARKFDDRSAELVGRIRERLWPLPV